jgi:hypothetical protein
MNVLVDGFGGSGTLVFIQVPPLASKVNSATVYLTPRASTDAFNARLGVYLMEE